MDTTSLGVGRDALQSGTPSPRPPPAFFFPERLPEGAVLGGCYEVRGYLSSGGFADVYHGVKRDTGMKIALKVLRAVGEADTRSEAEQRFLQDARVAARIDHPNVVTILACHEHMVLMLPEGQEASFERPYIAMELLEGWSLAEELQRHGPMSPARALHLMGLCLEGLAEGHERHIVHKDLKPSNLFLTHPGRLAESLKILDFGIARVVGDEQMKLTRTGEVFCTPQYAAPEYLSRQHVSPALDVYQMGLVLAEMLTGEPVVQSTRPFDCVQKHAEGVKLPEVLLQSPLGEFLGRATALEPERRYADAREMGESLRSLQQGEPVKKVPEEVGSEPGHPSRVFLTGVLAAVALAVLCAGLVPSTRVSQVEEVPTAEIEGATGGQTTSDPECRSPESCAKLAEVWAEQGDGVRAEALWRAACDDGHGPACTRLGWWLVRRDKGAIAPTALFARACERGDGAGCSAMGERHEEGLGVVKSLARARAFYARACERGHAVGCNNLGWSSEQRGRVKEAFGFFTQACEGGSAMGCTNLGRLVERALPGKRRDPARAAALHRQSCDTGEAAGCVNLARMVLIGDGVGRDPEQALALYHQGCEGGDGEGCLILGRIYEQGRLIPRDTERAAGFYERACQRGEPEGCRRAQRPQASVAKNTLLHVS